MRYKNILPNDKNANLGTSTLYVLGVDMIEIANSKLIIKTYFIGHKNAKILAYFHCRVHLHG